MAHMIFIFPSFFGVLKFHTKDNLARNTSTAILISFSQAWALEFLFF